MLGALLSLLLWSVSPAWGRSGRSAAAQGYRECGVCVKAGYGWCPIRRKCGGFKNRHCSGTETDRVEPVQPYVATGSNFDELLARPEHLLLSLCVPYDGRCRQHEAPYSLVANHFLGGKEVVVATLDCDQHVDLARRLGASVYPTLIFVASDSEQGARDSFNRTFDYSIDGLPWGWFDEPSSDRAVDRVIDFAEEAVRDARGHLPAMAEVAKAYVKQTAKIPGGKWTLRERRAAEVYLKALLQLGKIADEGNGDVMGFLSAEHSRLRRESAGSITATRRKAVATEVAVYDELVEALFGR